MGLSHPPPLPPLQKKIHSFVTFFFDGLPYVKTINQPVTLWRHPSVTLVGHVLRLSHLSDGLIARPHSLMKGELVSTHCPECKTFISLYPCNMCLLYWDQFYICQEDTISILSSKVRATSIRIYFRILLSPILACMPYCVNKSEQTNKVSQSKGNAK